MSERAGINWDLIALLGIGIAAVYLISKASSVAEAAAGVVSAAAEPVSSAIASGIELLTIGPSLQVTGSVDDQSGNDLGPISSFPASHDSQGNTYLAINGQWFMLGARDASGNFTAIPTGQAVS
jgi:hypothetical protein